MEINQSKPLEEKNIIEKHYINGQVKIGPAMLELENKIKAQELRIQGLEEAMQFFSEWYNKTQRVDLLVPEHLSSNSTGGIILPSSMTNTSKSIMD